MTEPEFSLEKPSLIVLAPGKGSCRLAAQSLP